MIGLFIKGIWNFFKQVCVQLYPDFCYLVRRCSLKIVKRNNFKIHGNLKVKTFSFSWCTQWCLLLKSCDLSNCTKSFHSHQSTRKYFLNPWFRIFWQRQATRSSPSRSSTFSEQRNNKNARKLKSSILINLVLFSLITASITAANIYQNLILTFSEQKRTNLHHHR